MFTDPLDPPVRQSWTDDSVTCASHTFQPMFQTVLHHHKELLERRVVRVKCASEVERRLDQALDAQLGHVHQVKPFDCDGILRIWYETGNRKGPEKIGNKLSCFNGRSESGAKFFMSWQECSFPVFSVFVAILKYHIFPGSYSKVV